MLELIDYKKLKELIYRINDTEITIDYFESFNVNPVIRNAFQTLIEDTLEKTCEFINTTIYRFFNLLRSNYSSTNKYTVSISNNPSHIPSLIREEVIMYLTDNNYIDSINVVFKIVPNLDDNYISKIASLIINQKNISLSFPKNSYNSDQFNEVEYFSTGLRIFENTNEYEKISTGRMVTTSTSINMARLGLKYLNNNSTSHFYEELDQLLELAKSEMLLIFENIGNKNKENYQILFNGNVYGDDRLLPGQKIRKIIKAGVLNIGLVGLKECIMCFEKEPNRQYNLLIEILEYINKKIKQYNEETKLYFQMFEPSDVKARKYFIGIDKSIYGGHKDITDKALYDLIETAAFIPDDKSLGVIQHLLSGGNLITINISNKTNNKKVVDLIKKLIDDDVGFVKMKVGK